MSEGQQNKVNPWMVTTLLLVGVFIGMGFDTIWSKVDGGSPDLQKTSPSTVTPPSNDTVPVRPTAKASELFQGYAGDLKLDQNQFNSCLETGKYALEIQKDLQDATSYGVSGTPGFLINGRYLKGARPYSDFSAIFEEELNGTAPSDVQRVEASTDDDAFIGDANAPITVIEFSDYQCPFCQRFFQQTLPQIKENYINTGKVKLVYRDLPLSIHQHAQKAAEAAQCAGEQGKYFEYHDFLFENLDFWSSAS